MPGMTVLGFCKTLAVSDSSFAILADFDTRGSAISALMLADIALTDFLLCFFMTSLRASPRLHALLMSQTIKQMINSVPSNPYPNMVPPSI
jgi:hypothetical protein